ncbi:class I SAM-dependent methyltransferase [Stappia stellulata]|uniref:class I SAM-dependent methyltransferase n=1 Tax=Stappia stellulata TaxID=71235 RepID=UPI00041CBEBC|nr:class I SAM-dependent methyltransferase [Stappia stellulata]
MPPDACPVCRCATVHTLAPIDGLTYWRCDTCEATVLDPRHYLSAEAEHAHYLTHENAPDDPGYRQFMMRLAVPLLARLSPRSKGLDFGSGPGSALAAILREAGHAVTLYDPFFHDDPAALKTSYDFVACSETAEHFHAPFTEFDRMGALLRPGGILAVMTLFQTDDARFAGWRYRRDPTHVVFYREKTLRHVANSRGWSCEIPDKDIALIRLPAPASGHF